MRLAGTAGSAAAQKMHYFTRASRAALPAVRRFAAL